MRRAAEMFISIKSKSKDVHMKKHRILSFLTATLLLITATACAKAIPEASKEHIYSAAPATVSGDLYDEIASAVWSGDSFYAVVSKSIETPPEDLPEEYVDIPGYVHYIYRDYIIRANDTGIVKQIETFEPSAENLDGATYGCLTAAPDGTVYAVEQKSEYTMGEDGVITDYRAVYNLVKIDSELNITPLLDIADALKDVLEDDWIWIRQIVVDKDGNLFVITSNSLYGIHTETGEVFYNSNDSSTSDYMQGLYLMPDGRAGVSYQRIDETAGDMSISFNIAPINASTGTLEPDMPFIYSMSTAVGGGAFYSYDGAYIYKLGGETTAADGNNSNNTPGKTIAADLLGSSVSNLNIGDIYYIDERRFGVMAKDFTNGTQGLYILTHRDPSDVPDKTLVTIAVMGTDMTVNAAVQSFNESSDTYRAELKVYGADTFDAADMLTSLNSDILAGNIPDVLTLNTMIPVRSYIAKDMFADLYPLMDGEDGVNRSEFEPALLKALETDGKLYSIAPAFTINTLTGKTSVFGGRAGLSFDELNEKAAAYPDAKLLGEYMTKENFMQTFVYMMIDNFTDYKTGECYFDTPEFVALLEAANQYPNEINYDNYDYEAMQAAYKDNKTLLSADYVNDFRAVSRAERTMFTEPVTFLGYPTVNVKAGSELKTGVAANLQSEVAIMSKAANPDGAWAFVRGLIEAENRWDKTIYMSSVSSSGGMNGHGTSRYSPNFSFSLKISENAKLAELAKTDPYMLDEQGKRIFEPNYEYTSEGMIELPNNTDADNEKTFKLLTEIDTVYRTDTALTEIISEDTKNYFDGKKTAKETAELIQNRATTYLQENL
jgi:hypothetical protein